VDFLHRTAQDFIELPEIWQLILSRTKITFNPYTRLIEACILKVKLAPLLDLTVLYGQGSADPRSVALDALACARTAKTSAGPVNVKVLDELDKTVILHSLNNARRRGLTKMVTLNASTPPATYKHWESSWNDKALHNEDDFLSLAVSYGLTEYVDLKLKQNSQSIHEKKGQPLLEYVFETYQVIEAELVSLLLKHGADPNQQYQGRSI
jgi:hypothetical protein